MAIQIHYWSPDVEQQLAYYVDVLSFELIHRQPHDAPADFCIPKFQDAQIMGGGQVFILGVRRALRLLTAQSEIAQDRIPS